MRSSPERSIVRVAWALFFALAALVLERVDVLTGGASAVYGADAVAGVVNFIMDTDFEGVRLDGQYSFYNHQNDARDTIITALQVAISREIHAFDPVVITIANAFHREM